MYLINFRWLGSSPMNVTVVDTPGFKDTDDAAFVDEIMSVLGNIVFTFCCLFVYIFSLSAVCFRR